MGRKIEVGSLLAVALILTIPGVAISGFAGPRMNPECSALPYPITSPPIIKGKFQAELDKDTKLYTIQADLGKGAETQPFTFRHEWDGIQDPCKLDDETITRAYSGYPCHWGIHTAFGLTGIAQIISIKVLEKPDNCENLKKVILRGIVEIGEVPK
jgi:hypothetical protein